MPPVKRLGFDAICLAAAVSEAQVLVGGRIQKAVQPTPLSLWLEIYAQQEYGLLISAEPEGARLHLTARRHRQTGEPTEALTLIRRRIRDAKVVFVRQRGLDRIVDIGLAGPDGEVQLVAEIMGRHSNLVVVDSRRRVMEALKRIGLAKSRRPILPGNVYFPPPFPRRKSIVRAEEGDDLSQFDGWSPSLQSLLDEGVLTLAEVQEAIAENAWRPHTSREFGVYPLPIPGGAPVASFSEETDIWRLRMESEDRRMARRRQLAAQLTRALKARQKAMGQLEQALTAADKAAETQRHGELLLAYQGSIAEGAREATVWDYDGSELRLKLDPEKTAVENAEALFRKARRAKNGADEAQSQHARMVEEAAALEAALDRIEGADDRALDEIEAEADRRRWLREAAAAVEKEDRPFQGHPIRTLLSPGGFKVLYGTNATSNDYLTTKVARPTDWWLHVRGQTSAHVVVQTQNQPLKVPYPDLVFAAEVAVRHSVAKHSAYVPVDYTLKKHVRKPRKSAPGFASYEQEKTIFIDKPAV
jgi:predicted ribosome quality control (RQC) complex YloA/Tae2 family protein